MKTFKSILKIIAVIILGLTPFAINAQYYTISKTVNPVTLCNSSTNTSVNIDIKCEGECNVIVEYFNNQKQWSYMATKSSDVYGNVRYTGTGLRLNQNHYYRVYVYNKNTRVNRYNLSASDFKDIKIYTDKICR